MGTEGLKKDPGVDVNDRQEKIKLNTKHQRHVITKAKQKINNS